MISMVSFSTLIALRKRKLKRIIYTRIEIYKLLDLLPVKLGLQPNNYRNDEIKYMVMLK